MRYRNPRSEKQRTLRCYSTSRSGTRTWLVTRLTPSDTVAHQTPPQANRLLRSGLALMNWSTISDTSRERSSSGYVAHIAAALLLRHRRAEPVFEAPEEQEASLCCAGGGWGCEQHLVKGDHLGQHDSGADVGPQKLA